MKDEELKALKAQIKIEQTSYLTELKSTQKFEKLKAIRLKINVLIQQLPEYERVN